MSRAWIWLVAGALLGAPAAAVAQKDSSRVTARRAALADTLEGWLGMGISCGPCTYQSEGRRGGTWDFSAPPTVFSVDPDGPAGRAGLRAGDTLVSIDGHPLTSARGGAAFGQVRPGQAVTLRYRRAGTLHEARLTATARRTRAGRELAEQYREMAARVRAETREQQREMQRQMSRTRDQLRKQREYMARVMAEMARARAEARVPDSAYAAALRAYVAQVDSAASSWRDADSLYAHLPTAPLPVLAPPETPAAPLPALAPLAPLAPAPMSARAWNREAGPLRYSGSLGDVVIEARAPGAVTATEVSDSEVVVTSRDMSVRITIPRPLRPARERRPAAPAPPARPERD